MASSGSTPRRVRKPKPVSGSLGLKLRRFRPVRVVVVSGEKERDVSLLDGRAKWEKAEQAVDTMLEGLPPGAYVELRDAKGVVLATHKPPAPSSADDDDDDDASSNAWDALVPARLVRDLTREMRVAMESSVKLHTTQADRLIAQQNEVTQAVIRRAQNLEKMSAQTLKLAYEATLQSARATAVLAAGAGAAAGADGEPASSADKLVERVLEQMFFGSGAPAEAEVNGAAPDEGAEQH